MKAWKSILTAAAASLLLITSFSACNREEKPESSAPSSSQTENHTVFPQGTSIGGRDISGKTAREALTAAREALEKEAAALEITVKFKDDTVSLTKDDFTVKDVLELSLPRLLADGKGGELPLSYVTDLSDKGREKLANAAKDCYVPGKDASISGFDTGKGAFVFTDESKGARADMTAILKSVRELLAQKKSGSVQAAFQETNPKVTKKKLSENFKLMSSYTTESTNTWNGNSNMALALSHVNGTVLKPGDVFSYNGTIGDSTDPDNGWLPAGGLMGGISVQMYGGGICQGSTTIYNAALMAGMEIIERDCHSSPSTYCPIGLDATVDYGNIDFRFRNPLETAVYIAAWMEDVTLHVNFYGCFPDEWDKITVGSEQTGSESPLDGISFTEDVNLKKGEYVRRSSGNTGYSARAWRTYYKGDKAIRTEELPSSYYAPTGKVYAVGAGTDTSKVDPSKESGTTEPEATPTPTPTPTPDPGESSDPSSEPEEDPSSQPGEDPTPVPNPTPDPYESSGVVDWSN